MSRFLVVPLLTALAGQGFAQERFGPIGGEQLLSLAGAVSFDTSSFENTASTNLTLSIQSSVGYFLTDEHELGLGLFGDYTIPDMGDNSVTVGLSPYYNYNVRADPRTWFYAGVHAGLSSFQSGDFDESGFAIGVQGGIRKWLGPRTAFFVEPRYTFSSYSDFDFHQTQIVFGYSFAL